MKNTEVSTKQIGNEYPFFVSNAVTALYVLPVRLVFLRPPHYTTGDHGIVRIRVQDKRELDPA